MAADGVERFVAIALAPQRSSNAAGYRRAVDAALAGLGDGRPGRDFVDSWYDQPRFIEALAETTARGARAASPTRPASASCSPPTACPARVVAEGDPYPDELAATAALVARAARPGRATTSPSRAPAGPASRGWARTSSTRSGGSRPRACAELVIRPVGFVADHLEVLYDIDIEAQAVAREAGIRLERARSMNDDPTFIAGLADLAEPRALRPASPRRRRGR